MSQIEEKPTPFLPDEQTPYPNGNNSSSNLPGSNLPQSLPLSQLPGLGQPTQTQPNSNYNQQVNSQQQHGNVGQAQAAQPIQNPYYPYPPQMHNQIPNGNAPQSNLPGQSSGSTPFPSYPQPHPQPQAPSQPPFTQVAQPQQPQQYQHQQQAQQPQPQYHQQPQHAYTNSNNNGAQSPVTPYMHTQPYPGQHVQSVPLHHSVPVHSVPHQYAQPYPGHVPQYGYPQHGPGPVMYQNQPMNVSPTSSNNNMQVPISGPGHYGLSHSMPPQQVYRPVDVVVKQTQQGQAVFGTLSQPVGPVHNTVQQERPTLIYDGPRSPAFFIKSRFNNLVLDARGTPDTIRQGTRLCVWPKKESDNSNQLWRWRQDGSIESFANPLLILDIEATNGEVVLNSPTGSPSQKWTVTGHKFLVNRAHNHVLDIKGEVKDRATDVIVWPHHGKKNQQWTIEYIATPFYIRCRKNGLVLDLANETTGNGTKVILANKKDHDPESQLWRWKGFNIENVKAGKALDLDNRNGTVGIWRCHNGSNQQWVFDGERLVNKCEDKVLDCDCKEHPGVNLICGKPSTNPLQCFDLAS